MVKVKSVHYLLLFLDSSTFAAHRRKQNCLANVRSNLREKILRFETFHYQNLEFLKLLHRNGETYYTSRYRQRRQIRRGARHIDTCPKLCAYIYRLTFCDSNLACQKGRMGRLVYSVCRCEYPSHEHFGARLLKYNSSSVISSAWA